MKTILTVSVDIEALINAKTKVSNISEYINQCLHSLSDSSILIDSEDVDSKLQELTNSINDLKIKKDILEFERKRKIELDSEREKVDEKFDRWICPVCQSENFLDQERCNNCQLPTRNSIKTKIINVKDSAVRIEEVGK